MSTNPSRKRKYHSDDDSENEELRLAKERVRRLEEKSRLRKLQRAKEEAEEDVAALKEKLELAELEFKTAVEAVEEYERELANQRKRRRREDETRNVDNQLAKKENVDSSVRIDVSLKKVPEARHSTPPNLDPQVQTLMTADGSQILCGGAELDHLRVGPCNRCKKTKIDCIRNSKSAITTCTACYEKRQSCAWGPNDCILFRKKTTRRRDQNDAN